MLYSVSKCSPESRSVFKVDFSMFGRPMYATAKGIVALEINLTVPKVDLPLTASFLKIYNPLLCSPGKNT